LRANFKQENVFKIVTDQIEKLGHSENILLLERSHAVRYRCITASGSRNHQLLAAMKKRRKSPNLPQDEGAPPLFLGALSE
jgi:ribosomal protein L15E